MGLAKSNTEGINYFGCLLWTWWGMIFQWRRQWWRNTEKKVDNIENNNCPWAELRPADWFAPEWIRQPQELNPDSMLGRKQRCLDLHSIKKSRREEALQGPPNNVRMENEGVFFARVPKKPEWHATRELMGKNPKHCKNIAADLKRFDWLDGQNPVSISLSDHLGGKHTNPSTHPDQTLHQGSQNSRCGGVNTPVLNQRNEKRPRFLQNFRGILGTFQRGSKMGGNTAKKNTIGIQYRFSGAIVITKRWQKAGFLDAGARGIKPARKKKHTQHVLFIAIFMPMNAWRKHKMSPFRCVVAKQGKWQDLEPIFLSQIARGKKNEIEANLMINAVASLQMFHPCIAYFQVPSQFSARYIFARKQMGSQNPPPRHTNARGYSHPRLDGARQGWKQCGQRQQETRATTLEEKMHQELSYQYFTIPDAF